MRLQDIMSTSVETIAPTVKAEKAWVRMQTKAVRHLVVTEDFRVVGILSDRDLGGSRGTRRRAGKTVADLMSASVVNARPRTTVRQAANSLRGRNIGCLPILDERERLIGIVTISDLLELIGRGLERSAQRNGTKASVGRRQRVAGRRGA